MNGQEREALEAARNAWHDETGKWPRQSGLYAAVRAALGARVPAEDTERPDVERVVCKLCNGKGYRRVAGADYTEPCGCEDGKRPAAVRDTEQEQQR